MAMSGLAPPVTMTRSARSMRARAVLRSCEGRARRRTSRTASLALRASSLRRRREPSPAGEEVALALPHQPAAERVRIGDGRREADRLQAGRQRAQPRQAEREEVAALVGDQRVQLVEDHRVEVGEEAVGVGRRQEQRRLLRRGQQDVRRVQLLALALVRPTCRRCASPASPSGRSRRPALRGCGRCRRPAPSAARCRGCGCRARRSAPWRSAR